MDKKEMPTSVLIPRLLQSMKHLLPRIAVAVCFAVLGQVVTIAIPVMLVYLAFNALTGNPAPLWTLGALVILALLRGAFRYGEHYSQLKQEQDKSTSRKVSQFGNTLLRCFLM